MAARTRLLAQFAWLSAAVLGLLAPASLAQTPEPPSAIAATSTGTPPRTARITFLNGGVQIQRSNSTNEDSPVLNMPITEGTRIVTADYGQAEIEFEDGSVARLTPRTTLSLDAMTLTSSGVAHTQLALLSGLAYFELRKSSVATYLVTAGGTNAAPVENLTLRVNLDEPPAIFAVLTGAAQLGRGESFNTQVRAGESLRTDPRDETRYFLTAQIADESWDRWNESRDQGAADQAGKRTVARDGFAGSQGYGWSDLDANGSWYNVPGQGQVWQPAVADDAFDPYDNGAWVWSSGGYLWASSYSWGWTPFRCGHWIFFPGFGWGWVPDAYCGTWGYRSVEQDIIIYGGGGPPRHRPVKRPVTPPGPPRPLPLVPVRSPRGLRPPVLVGAPLQIDGKRILPFRPIDPRPTPGGSAIGKALALDFPVDRKTHQAIFGTAPGSTATMRPVSTGTDATVPEKTVSPPARGPVPDAPVRIRHNPVQPPTSAPAPTRMPPPAPMPTHPAPQPAPQPAPVHTAPPPAPTPSRPAPAPGPAPTRPESVSGPKPM